MEKPHSESNQNKTKPPSQPDSKDKLKAEESPKKLHEDVEIKYKYIRAEPKKPIETSFILPSDQNSKEHIDRRLPNTRLQVSRGYDLFTGEDTVVKIKIYRTVITNGIQTEMRLAANIILLLKPHQQKQKVRGFDGSNEMIIRLYRA